MKYHQAAVTAISLFLTGLMCFAVAAYFSVRG